MASIAPRCARCVRPIKVPLQRRNGSLVLRLCSRREEYSCKDGTQLEISAVECRLIRNILILSKTKNIFMTLIAGIWQLLRSQYGAGRRVLAAKIGFGSPLQPRRLTPPLPNLSPKFFIFLMTCAGTVNLPGPALVSTIQYCKSDYD